LRADPHLQVHRPRGKRTQRCNSCLPGVTTGAECHPTRGSGENLSLQAPMDRARGPGNAHRVTFRRKIGHGDPGTWIRDGFRCSAARCIGGNGTPGRQSRCRTASDPTSGCGSAPPGAAATHEAHPAVQLVRTGCTYRCGMPPNSRVVRISVSPGANRSGAPPGNRLSCPFDRPRRQRQPASDGMDSVREVGAPWTAGMLPSRPAW
jgi:hypothetical protein